MALEELLYRLSNTKALVAAYVGHRFHQVVPELASRLVGMPLVIT